MLKFKNTAKLLVIFFLSAVVALAVVYFYKLSLLVVVAGIVSIILIALIFKDPFFGACIVAFLLPFERIASFEAGGITIRSSQIFVLVTIFSWLFYILTKRRDKAVIFGAKNPLIIPIFFFLGFSILSMVNCENFTRSISVFLFNIFTIIISLILPNLITDEKKLNKIIYIILFVSFLISLFGFYQFLGDASGLPSSITGLREHYTKDVFGFPRVQSTFLEPLYFANFLLVPIALCFSLLLARGKKISLRKKIFLIFILGFAIINLILTLSRGGYVALAVSLFLIFLIYIKSFFSFKRISIFFLIGIVAFFSVLGFLKFTGKEKNISKFLNQATNFSKGVAIKQRGETIDTAWQMVKERPFLGFGPGSFGPYAAVSPSIQPSGGWLIVNNIFLEIWTEEGIFGLISFLILIVIIILRTFKAWQVANIRNKSYLKNILIGLFVAFLAIFVQYQTFSILYILHIWFLIGLLCVCQNLILRPSGRTSSEFTL